MKTKNQWPSLVYSIVVLLLGVSGIGYGKDYFIGPDKLELPANAVLGTDSYGPYADIPTPSGCRPGDWDYCSTLAQNYHLAVEAGRYRATFLLRTAPFGMSPVRIEFFVGYSAPHDTRYTCEITGPDLPRDDSVYSLSMDVSLPTEEIGVVLQYWDNNARELTAVRLYGLTLERLDKGLALTKVRPRKLLYAPGEAGVVDVTVRNFTNAEMAAMLELTILASRFDSMCSLMAAIPARSPMGMAGHLCP